MRYDAYETLVVPARFQPALWRLVAGFVLALAVYMALTMMYGVGLSTILQDPAAFMAVVEGAQPATMIAFLFTFVFMALGTIIATLTLHGRGLLSLTGPVRHAFSQGARAFGALVLLTIALAVLPPYNAMDLSPNLALGTWLSLLPIAFALVFIQVSAEELLFRGYLQSQLAARFASPLIWLPVPAVIFGLFHFSGSDFGPNAPYIVLWAIGFGLVAGDLTARTGTLGPAIALHLANNLTAMLVVSLDGPMSGLALYTLNADPRDQEMMLPLLAVDGIMMLVSWLAIRLALRV